MNVAFHIGPNGAPLYDLVNFERIVARRHYRDLRNSGLDRTRSRQFVVEYWRSIDRARG